MEKYILGLLFSLLFGKSYASVDSLIIDMKNGEKLIDYIDENKMKEVKYLKISGHMSVSDLKVIYENMCGFKQNITNNGYTPVGSLKVLDISNVILEAGSFFEFGGPVSAGTIPQNYFSIRDRQVGTILEELYLPKCKLEDWTFSFSENLRKLEMANGTTIGKQCFYKCISLDTITIPNSVNNGILYSFKNDNILYFNVDTSNIKYSSIDGVITSKDKKTLYSVPSGLKKYITPPSINKLSNTSFFNNSKIQTICLGDNLVEIEDSCFYKCINLSKIIIKSSKSPNLKTDIYNPFSDCKKFITYGKLYVPKGTYNLYSSMSGWKDIPNIIEYEESEFENIFQEDAEEVGDNFDFKIDGIYYKVTSIPEMTVGVCNGGVEYEGRIEIPSSVSYKNKDFKVSSIICMSGRNLKSVSLPETIEQIGGFGGSGIDSLIMPNSVKTIEVCAFAFCDRLKYVKISDNVHCLKSHVFENCISLKKVDWTPSNGFIGIEERAFQECQSLTSFTIPSQTSFIGNQRSEESAFLHCSSLDTLIIEDNDSGLELPRERHPFVDKSASVEGEFYLCPINTLYIGRNLYYTWPPHLYPDNIIIGDDLQTINYWTNNNNTLKTLTIGKKLTSVPSFTSNTSLEKITLRGKNPPIAAGFSNQNYMNATLYVPKGSKVIYETTDVWKYFWNIEEYIVEDDSNDVIDIKNDNCNNVKYIYDISGILKTKPSKGINIMKYENGDTKKILLR